MQYESHNYKFIFFFVKYFYAMTYTMLTDWLYIYRHTLKLVSNITMLILEIAS